MRYISGMVDYPYLTNAPIREALIDFRVRLGPRGHSDIWEDLTSVAASLEADYSAPNPIYKYRGRIEFGSGGPVSTQEGSNLVGQRLVSSNQRNVAQLRLDGFTFSRLPPYKSWDRLVADAWLVWERYRRGMAPLGVERVAVRFINRIPVQSFDKLGTMFRKGPRVPDGEVDKLYYRYQLVPSGGVTAIVSLATEDADERAMILDIDCFVRKPLPLHTDILRRELSKLRSAKNRVFFCTLTEDAIARFQ